MRRGLRAGALLLVAMNGALVPLAVAAPDPAGTAREVAHSLDLQVALPGDGTPSPTPGAQKPSTRNPPADRSSDPMESGILRAILYAAIGGGILFALWTMRDRLPAFGRGRLTARNEAPERAPDASVARMVAAQTEADELARQGRLAEAMHMLLLRSLVEVRRRLDVSFADSLTSREILKVLALSDTGKLSLADIVSRVELVHFGDREAGSGDYSACRLSYEQLLQAMRAGPA